MPDLSGQDLDFIRNRSAAGGVNSYAFPFDIGDNEAVELTNIDASTRGIRKSRQGVSLVASGITFGPILTMSPYQAVSADTELLAVSPGATFPNAQHLKLWSWDGTASTWSLKGTLTGFTSATVGIEIVPGIDLNSVSGKPYLARIFTQQSIALSFVYDGTNLGSTNAAAAVPAAGFFPAADVLNRGFASADAANRAKIYFTDTGMFGFTGWSTTQNVTMGGGARQLVKAIKPFRNRNLITFMADRIEAIILADSSLVPGAGDAGIIGPYRDWSREVIDTSIGCAGYRCVASTGEDLLFADQLGNVRSLNQTITDNQQGVKGTPLSIGIQGYIDRINAAAIDKINAVFYDRFCFFGFPLDSATDVSHTFAWDVVNKAWYGPYTGLFPARSMAAATMTNASAAAKYQNPSLYLGSAATTGGLVYHAFDGVTDAGAAIVYQETSKRYNGDQLEAPKFFRRLADFYQATGSETMLVEARKDGGAWTQLGTIDLTGDTPSLPLTFPFSFGGSGVVKKRFSLERFGEQVQDMQFRYTATASGEIRHLGFSVALHRKNFDWTVD